MLTRDEIKEAAETIACEAWENGASEDGVIEKIDAAFKSDGVYVNRKARTFARRWMADVNEVE
jgi:hypothetical protein